MKSNKIKYTKQTKCSKCIFFTLTLVRFLLCQFTSFFWLIIGHYQLRWFHAYILKFKCIKQAICVDDHDDDRNANYGQIFCCATHPCKQLYRVDKSCTFAL